MIHNKPIKNNLKLSFLYFHINCISIRIRYHYSGIFQLEIWPEACNTFSIIMIVFGKDKDANWKHMFNLDVYELINDNLIFGDN